MPNGLPLQAGVTWPQIRHQWRWGHIHPYVRHEWPYSSARQTYSYSGRVCCLSSAMQVYMYRHVLPRILLYEQLQATQHHTNRVLGDKSSL
jgi:hypothetical protein